MGKFIYLVYDEKTRVITHSVIGDNNKAVMNLVKYTFGWTGLNASKGPVENVVEGVKTGYVYGRTETKKYSKVPYLRIRANDIHGILFK